MRRIKPLLPIDPNLDQYTRAYGAIKDFASQGFLVELVGAAGSGKTTIANNYRESHEHTHLIVCSPAMGIKDLMQKIAEKIGLQLTGNTYKFQDQLTSALIDRAEHTFILDECEYLSRNSKDKLDILRQIWDQTSNVFIFCGTYKLRKLLIGESNDPESEYSQLYRRLKKVKMNTVKQAEFYNYLDFIESHYAVAFGKEARNTLFGYCSDIKHGGLGTCIEIIKIALNSVRPEWISISIHLAYGEETRKYFPDSFRMQDYGDDLHCYSPHAVHINKDDISKLKTADVSASLIRSVSKYQILV